MRDGTKNRVQGEAPRVTSCKMGGEHVLWRPVQKYCDRCRPKETTADLERHRARRARLKAQSALAKSTESTPANPAVIDRQQTPLTLAGVLDAGLQLIEQHRHDVDEQVATDVLRRRRNGMPVGPALARLDPYAQMRDHLESARNLAAQLGL